MSYMIRSLPTSLALSPNPLLLTVLQPHWPFRNSLNMPNPFLPQGLCTSSLLCLDSPTPGYSLPFSHLLQIFVQKCHLNEDLRNYLKSQTIHPSTHPQDIPPSLLYLFHGSHHFLAYGRAYCYFVGRSFLAEGRDFYLFCSVLYPQYLEQCLAHRDHSISSVWMKGIGLCRFETIKIRAY